MGAVHNTPVRAASDSAHTLSHSHTHTIRLCIFRLACSAALHGADDRVACARTHTHTLTYMVAAALQQHCTMPDRSVKVIATSSRRCCRGRRRRRRRRAELHTRALVHSHSRTHTHSLTFAPTVVAVTLVLALAHICRQCNVVPVHMRIVIAMCALEV